MTGVDDCTVTVGVFGTPKMGAWECPRCHMINAPWVEQCNCQPQRRVVTWPDQNATDATSEYGHVYPVGEVVYG